MADGNLDIEDMIDLKKTDQNIRRRGGVRRREVGGKEKEKGRIEEGKSKKMNAEREGIGGTRARVRQLGPYAYLTIRYIQYIQYIQYGTVLSVWYGIGEYTVCAVAVQ